MRNYIKIQCLRLYPLPFDPESFYVVFGGTDENLLYYVNRLHFLLDPITFRIPAPSIIWFELNQENFSTLLNQASGAIWTQTRLNDVFEPFSDAELLYDMTRVQVQGSPRKTWSNGH